MRQGVIHLHLDDFRIDHDEAQILRREAVEDAGDDGVDAHALTRAGGASDEAVGHRGEVSDDRFAINVLAKCDRNFGFGGDEVFAFEQFAQGDFLLFGIGDFDADGVLAGDGRQDIDALGARGACEVAFAGGDAIHADALCGINFVARDGRAFGDVSCGHGDAEFSERFDDAILDAEQFVVAGNDAVFGVHRIEQIEGREFVVLVMQRREQLDFLFFLLFFSGGRWGRGGIKNFWRWPLWLLFAIE